MRKNFGAKPYTCPQPGFIFAAHVAECGYVGAAKLAPWFLTLSTAPATSRVRRWAMGSRMG